MLPPVFRLTVNRVLFLCARLDRLLTELLHAACRPNALLLCVAVDDGSTVYPFEDFLDYDAFSVRVAPERSVLRFVCVRCAPRLLLEACRRFHAKCPLCVQVAVLAGCGLSVPLFKLPCSCAFVHRLSSLPRLLRAFSETEVRGRQTALNAVKPYFM